MRTCPQLRVLVAASPTPRRLRCHSPLSPLTTQLPLTLPLTLPMRVGRRALSTGVRVLLRKRPAANQPVTEHCFEVREGGCSPAAAVCAAGQLSAADMLYCRTLYLSVDPFLRCRFNASTGVDYTQPYQPGEPLTSAGIGQVIACGQRASERGFAAGDLVLQPFDAWPWASAVSIPASSVSRIPVALGVLAWPRLVVLAGGQSRPPAAQGALILERDGRSELQSRAMATWALGRRSIVQPLRGATQGLSHLECVLAAHQALGAHQARSCRHRRCSALRASRGSPPSWASSTWRGRAQERLRWSRARPAL